MLYGIRPEEQLSAGRGGPHRAGLRPLRAGDWYGYLMRRLAEQPANLAFFGRALLSKG